MKNWTIFLLLVFTSVTGYAQKANIPPEVRADLLKQQIYDDLRANRVTEVLEGIAEIRDLGVPVPVPLLYVEAKAADSTGDPSRAVRALEQYFAAAPRTQERYSEALSLMRKVEPAAAEANREAGVRRAVEAEREAADAKRRAKEEQAAALQSLLSAMVDVPGGSFKMGSSGETYERPVHAVTLSPFRLMKYEVTFAQYDAFARATARELPDDRPWGRGQQPVINVSWEDAQAFADWVSKQTSQRFRLPTEAEWEYAARAGVLTDYHWGDVFDGSRVAGSDVGKPVPVGSFPANTWGLHDMSGNVREWTGDCWNETYQGAPVDGSAWLSGNCAQRVVRGGSWYNNPTWLRVSTRDWYGSAYRDDTLGFRLAQDL